MRLLSTITLLAIIISLALAHQGSLDTLALPPGTIDEESGVFTPDDPADPTLETDSTRGSTPTTSTETLRLVHYYWDGNADCKTTSGVIRRSMMYTAGGSCNYIYGAGYTVRKYYRAICRGSTMSDSSISYNETVSLQFFSDAACTQPSADELLVDQRTCLPANEFGNESQVYFCEVGVAPCHLCTDNAASSAVVGTAVAAAVGLAAWFGF